MATHLGQFTARYATSYGGDITNKSVGMGVLIVVEQVGEEVRYRTWDGEPVSKVSDGVYKRDNLTDQVLLTSDDPNRI